MAKASMMPASVEPCFETFTNISPGAPLLPGVSLSYSPTVTKPLRSPTLNSKVREARVLGSLCRTGRGADSSEFSDVSIGADSPTGSFEPAESGCATLQFSR